MRELPKNWIPTSLETRPERVAFCSLVACVALSLISIAASQIMLAVAIAAFLWNARTQGTGITWRPAFLPLVLFFAWTIAAAFASSDVWLGLGIVKKFYLFLLIPLVPPLLAGEERVRRAYEGIIAVGLFASAAGMIQFAEDPHRDLLHRISGFMSHWMTYSGLLMIVLVCLVAYGFARGWRKHPWIVAMALLLAIPISLSQTRNAMIGAIAGVIALLVLLGRSRFVGALLILVAAAYFAAPGSFRQRVSSGWDPNDPNTRNRLELFGTSVRLIRDNPVFGVGPKNVQIEALRYRGSNEYPNWLYQHMHNNFLQIAAERGLPGLALWLWLMARFALDAWRVLRRGTGSDAQLASSAALGCWVALLVSGMVEYNFGDSEVLTLFLFVQSAPYAFPAAAGQSAASALAEPRA
jgi:O-antigen ligase